MSGKELRETIEGILLEYAQEGLKYPTSDEATDALLALIKSETDKARYDEVAAAWRRAPKDDDYRPTDIVTVYLEKRLAELQKPEEKEGA